MATEVLTDECESEPETLFATSSLYDSIEDLTSVEATGVPSLDLTLGRTATEREKSAVLRRLLRRLPPSTSTEPDLAALLRQLAISTGGLVHDSFRAAIWPRLARCHPGGPSESNGLEGVEGSSVSSDGYFSTDSTPPDPLASEDEGPSLSDEDLMGHRDWRQVEMDVHRTLARFPPNIDETKRLELQKRLTPLIVRLLWSNPTYSYYQGFHDILLTILLVTDDEEAALEMGKRLCSIGLFPFLTDPIENIDDTLQLIYVIIYQADPDLEAYLRKAQVGTTFSLSWVITWFAHAIDDYDSVVRLYDLFLASHPLMPVYLSAAVVLMRSRELQEDMEPDMAMLHSALLKTFTAAHVPLEALISDAQELFKAWPPSGVENQLRGAYKATVALEEEAAKIGRSMRRSVSWHLGTGVVPRPVPLQRRQEGGVFQYTFWAVSATAAAWYLYTHSDTWYRLLN